MNEAVWKKQKQGIAIALKQFPELKQYDKKSGIYLWNRINEDNVFCWYVGKAKNILRRTAQHIVDGQSHLDKSIKKHNFYNEKNPNGWQIMVLAICEELLLDKMEQNYIATMQQQYPDSKMYNVESGGTTGKTIIGERKQRKDQKWRTEARTKAFDDIRKWFELQAKNNAIKPNGELYAEAKKSMKNFIIKTVDNYMNNDIKYIIKIKEVKQCTK